MRILQCLSRSSLGGGQVVVFSLLKALRATGDNMTLAVALPRGGPYVERFRKEGFTTYEVDFNSPFLRPSSVRSLVSGFSPDVIHSHQGWAGFHVRRALRRSAQYRLFHSFHGFHPTGSVLKRKAEVVLENMLADRTDALVCLSESEANEVHRLIPHSRGRIQVIQNCVDVEQIRKDARQQLSGELSAWFGRNREKRILSMIARRTPVKNHDLAFAAAEQVMKSDPRYAFLFVGVPRSDRRYKRLRKRFGPSIFAVPYLSNIAPVIARSWSLFLPSRREACPTVILEGFALGVPTIGTRAPGIVDVLQDSWNGFLMDPVPLELRSILQKVGQHEELYADAKRGANEQGEYLRMRAWARQYTDVYTMRPDASRTSD